MKRIEDLNFTASMHLARVFIESNGYVLEGWDEFDFEKKLSRLEAVRFKANDVGGYYYDIFCYRDDDGRLYKPYGTLYYRGGKIKSCMVFRRVDNGSF